MTAAEGQGVVAKITLPDDVATGEPFFVPRSAEKLRAMAGDAGKLERGADEVDNGWLLTFAYNFMTNESSFLVCCCCSSFTAAM
jgi:Retinal pigment epithelial membrane protein